MHNLLVLNSNCKISIISIPKYSIDLGSGKKFLAGFLHNNCMHVTLVNITSDFIEDLLALSKNSTKVNSLAPVLDFSLRAEKKKFNILDCISIC